MREDEYNDLKEQGWRRRLNASELAAVRQFLAGNPRAGGEWASEESLNRLLEQLPAVPVSSNFTARVLAAAQAEQPSQREAAVTLPWIFRSWWPRWVAGALMVGAGFFSFQEYHTMQRAREAQALAAASQLAAVPPMEWLNDFDTIQSLDKVKVADDDLLSVLE